jgi:VanZ family protein
MSASAVVFIAFVAWIIYMADAGRHTVFFTWVKAIPYGDKVGHFFLFFTLAFFVNYLLKFKKTNTFNIPIHFGSVVVLIFITIEEFSQLFFSGRTFDLFDLLFGVLGIAVVQLIIRNK